MCTKIKTYLFITENPCVPGSIPGGTTYKESFFGVTLFLCVFIFILFITFVMFFQKNQCFA